MRLALRLARRGYGRTSPNPMVGAVLVKRGQIIGRGWHRRAGLPHAEIEAMRDAHKRGHNPKGATLYVTLEPCSTQGRTPPCTEAIVAAGIRRVVAGATDPNPQHAGRGFRILRRAGLAVAHGSPGRRMRAAQRSLQPLDRAPHPVRHRQGGNVPGRKNRHRHRGIQMDHGRTGPRLGHEIARRRGCRPGRRQYHHEGQSEPDRAAWPVLRARPCAGIVLDPRGRTPCRSRILSDSRASLTTIVVTKSAPPKGWPRCAGARACWWPPPGAGGLTCPGCSKPWAGKTSPAFWWKEAAKPTRSGCAVVPARRVFLRAAHPGRPQRSHRGGGRRRAVPSPAKSPCATLDGGGSAAICC